MRNNQDVTTNTKSPINLRCKNFSCIISEKNIPNIKIKLPCNSTNMKTGMLHTNIQKKNASVLQRVPIALAAQRAGSFRNQPKFSPL